MWHLSALKSAKGLPPFTLTLYASQAVQPTHSDWSIEEDDPAVVAYGEGEATISLKHEDLPTDCYEDLTSDDEY